MKTFTDKARADLHYDLQTETLKRNPMPAKGYFQKIYIKKNIFLVFVAALGIFFAKALISNYAKGQVSHADDWPEITPNNRGAAE